VAITGVRGVLVSGLLLVCSGAGSAATLTVMNANDSGGGTLRECMTVANANPGADTIVFNIPGSGVHTIALTSPLPPLTDDAGVTINGYTQPGAHPNTLAIGNDAALLIELSGSMAGANAIGIDIQSLASTIRGLVVTGFDRNGVGIREDDVTIAGCFVGTDPTGMLARPNRFAISAFPLDPKSPLSISGVTIGGFAPADRNVVSGNLLDGVIVFNASATAILGNYIGTNAAGNAALPNGSSGVVINSSIGSSVGGTSLGATNVISGNLGPGVTLYFAGGSAVEGNLIGTNAAGTAFLPNSTGVWVFSSQDTSIGGFTNPPGNVNAMHPRNVIAGNLSAGVKIFGLSTMNNSVLSNSIRNNGGLGIDLGGDGVSPNDAGDADDGPNLLQNFPVMTSAVSTGGSTTISGALNGLPQKTFRIEFFLNEACDPSGFGEGASLWSSTDVTTDSAGNATFSAVLPSSLAPGQLVTATATDPDGNTSEFSPCQAGVVLPAGSIPTLDAKGAAILGLLLAASGFFLVRRVS
jgi:hypothetical protein